MNDEFTLGQYVVRTEGKHGKMVPGDISIISERGGGGHWFLADFGVGHSGRKLRPATQEEINAYQKGTRNIKYMPKKKVVEYANDFLKQINDLYKQRQVEQGSDLTGIGEEIEIHLIDEAEKRGVWESPIITTDGQHRVTSQKLTPIYDLKGDVLWSTYGRVYHKGKWATPIKSKEQVAEKVFTGETKSFREPKEITDYEKNVRDLHQRSIKLLSGENPWTIGDILNAVDTSVPESGKSLSLQRPITVNKSKPKNRRLKIIV